jgi:hypothetical protein
MTFVIIKRRLSHVELQLIARAEQKLFIMQNIQLMYSVLRCYYTNCTWIYNYQSRNRT